MQEAARWVEISRFDPLSSSFVAPRHFEIGFRQLSMRGLMRAEHKFTLVCMALNLRRMSGMMAWK